MRNARSDRRTSFPVLPALLASGLTVAALAGCSDESSPVGPEIHEPEAPNVIDDLRSLHEAADASGVRLEVEVGGAEGAWDARELEVMTGSDEARAERIRSPVNAVDVEAGTLTLALGGVVVRAAPDAAFESEDGRPLGRAVFFEAVAGALAAGERPAVELSRPPVWPAQSPDDGSFRALELRLDPDAARPSVELNVDGRHLDLVSDDAGTLTVLAVGIPVDLGTGAAIVERSAEQQGAVEIEGLVASVDPSAGTITLGDGTTLRVDEDTRFKKGDDRLGSLEEIAAALDADRPVEVEAEAVEEGEDLYLAVEVEAEAEENSFGGQVVSVDLDEGSFMLVNGRSYLVTHGTEFDERGDLESLEAMWGALETGDRVTVQGSWGRSGAGLRLVLGLKVEASGSDPVSGFGGRVVSVDADAGSFRLTSGRSYLVTEDTDFDEEGDLTSLDDMEEALEMGAVVTVEGQWERNEVGFRVALALRAQTNGDDDGEEGEGEEEDEEDDGDDDAKGFGGRVVSVDPDEGSITLVNGRTYLVNEDTEFDEEGDLMSLEAMSGALETGDVVTVEGTWEENEDGDRVALTLKVQASGDDEEENEFGGRVVSVDLDGESFTLTSGRTYLVTGDTEFDDEGDLTSLAAMSGALETGDVVTVEGEWERDEAGYRVALTVKAEASGDDEDDEEDNGFGGRVVSVDLDEESFTLTSGRTYLVTGDTEFDDEGELTSLAAMSDALDAGAVVTVEGEWERNEEGYRVAVEVTVRRSGS